MLWEAGILPLNYARVGGGVLSLLRSSANTAGELVRLVSVGDDIALPHDREVERVLGRERLGTNGVRPDDVPTYKRGSRWW